MSAVDQTVNDLMSSIRNHLGSVIWSKRGAVVEGKDECIHVAIPTDNLWIVLSKNNEFDLTASHPSGASWTGTAYPSCVSHSGCSWAMVAWVQKLLFIGQK